MHGGASRLCASGRRHPIVTAQSTTDAGARLRRFHRNTRDGPTVAAPETDVRTQNYVCTDDLEITLVLCDRLPTAGGTNRNRYARTEIASNTGESIHGLLKFKAVLPSAVLPLGDETTQFDHSHSRHGVSAHAFSPFRIGRQVDGGLRRRGVEHVGDVGQ